MKNGTRPTPLDVRDYSFHRTFGGTMVSLGPVTYTNDAKLTMPDQNADGYPYGCTGFSQADIGTDEDQIRYQAPYTYLKTCLMEGHVADQGCDIRTSIKSTSVYGLLQEGEVTDLQAARHRRGAYFNVYCDGGYDWFDSMRVVLRQGKSISVGTPWLPAWEQIAQNGIIPGVFILTGRESWHNYKLCGEKVINGIPYLEAKSWQGSGYGDGGFCYFRRDVVNKMMEIAGSVAFTFAKANPADVKTIKLDILETILNFMYRILGLKRLA